MAFRPNKSLRSAIMEAARQADAPLHTRLRIRAALAFASTEDLQELEKELTYEACKAGVIKRTAKTVVGDVYVGEWGDGAIIKWIIENWDTILKMIMSIIALFQSAPSIIGILIFCGALLFASTASANCTGGTCRVAPVRRVVDKTVVVVTETQPVRTVVKRVIHRERRPVVRVLFRR